MKSTNLALLLLIVLFRTAGAQLPAAFVSNVNPLENQDFAAAFSDLVLKGNVLHLRPSTKDSSFKIQIETGPITLLSQEIGADLPIGKEAYIFDSKMYVKFLAFPLSETKKYLFLVEFSNAQGLTRVGLISVLHPVQTLDHQTVPTADEQPIVIDCVRCLKEMEDRVAKGTYEYEG